MPQLILWGVPPDTPGVVLRNLERDLITAGISIKELGLKDSSDFQINFPAELDRGRPTREIMVQVSELWKKDERTPEVRNRLAEALGKVVREKFYWVDTVAVRLDPLFDDKCDGFWMNQRPATTTSLEDPVFELSTYTQTVLRANSINTLGDLIKKSTKELMAMERFGPRCLNEVNRAVIKSGYNLSDNK